MAVNVTKDGAPVKGVKLTVNGETKELFDGATELKLYTGRNYAYTVEAPGCRTVSGTFDVLGEARTLDIAMEPSPGAGITGETVTVYVSLMDGDKYMTDGNGDIYRRPRHGVLPDLGEIYMSGYYDDYVYDRQAGNWTKTDGPSGRVTVLMALLEVERQFYGENTLTLTERNKNIGSPYVYMENFGGEVTRFMGSARPVNLFL